MHQLLLARVAAVGGGDNHNINFRVLLAFSGQLRWRFRICMYVELRDEVAMGRRHERKG